MAGLCGWFHHLQTRQDHESTTERMARELTRFDGSVPRSLSNERFGLSASSLGGIAIAQRQGELAIALHGRVFNAEGVAMDGESAISEILLAYKESGIDAVFEGFKGPFSFILLDLERKLAYAATDRLGICPMVCGRDINGGVVFGSSAHCLLAHPEVSAEISPQSLYDYLFFHVVPSPGKAYQGLRALQPGEYARCDHTGMSIGRYWRMHYADEAAGFNLDAAKAEAHRLTEQGVARLSDADNIGAFLSGGIDSSTVAGKLKDVRGESNTFSIGFSAEGFDEMDFARQSARHFDTKHFEYYVTPADIVELAPRMAAVYDAPFGNASTIGAYYCARLAKENGMDLILGGDGGDELFAGNERYLSQQVFGHYERLPSMLRRGLIEPLLGIIPLADKLPVIKKAVSYVNQANMPMPDRLMSYNLLLRLGATNLLTDGFLAQINADSPMQGLRSWYSDGSDAQDMLQHMLTLDLKLTLADNDLPKVSRMCELAGIEVAYPMLDEALLAFSGTIPSDANLKDGKLRWFFKEAMRGYLPDETLVKKKQGFGLPFGIWCTQDDNLRALAGDNLSDLKARGIVRRQFIEELWDKHLPAHPTYYGTLIWLLLVLELWLKHHAPEYRL